MTKQLQQQFQTLSLLSILDQSILKAENGEKVLEIIFNSLKNLVNYDLLVLGTYREPSRLELIIDYQDEPRTVNYVRISPKELDNLKHSKEITLNLKIVTLPQYLVPIKAYPIKRLIIFPILHKHSPTAIICLGFESLEALNVCNTEELHDIFYRAAVAFTHADWEERLYHQAHYDDLTGLPNRLVLKDQLNQALIRGSDHNYYTILMFLDLDNFKDINDTLGHGIGDQFLSLVSKTMQEAVGSQYLISRIGGDEFTVLITDLRSSELAHKKSISTAEKLLHVFDNPFMMNNVEFHITASIGIVIAPDDATKGEELIKFADMSMYKAKESGKNCYVFFSTTLEKMVTERNILLQEMHTALHEDQFCIYLQPKINCLDNSLVGAEVLIRWNHPEHGIVLPDVFLPLAEDSSLIIPLGAWVFRKACLQLNEWRSLYGEVPSLAINIAAKQLSQPNPAQQIELIIADTGVDATRLEFEITESSLIGNLKETIAILEQLHSLGSRLSIDDFGTGYSSMRYLQILPLDNMKIDRIFIQDLLTDKKNVSIIKAIITLGNNLGLALIAEGIESKEQSELLATLGCTVQQGFYFSEPLTPEAFAKRYLKKQDQ
jgi:diguanylate cyclase (GGDEF)-like protein